MGADPAPDRRAIDPSLDYIEAIAPTTLSIDCSTRLAHVGRRVTVMMASRSG